MKKNIMLGVVFAVFLFGIFFFNKKMEHDLAAPNVSVGQDPVETQISETINKRQYPRTERVMIDKKMAAPMSAPSNPAGSEQKQNDIQDSKPIYEAPIKDIILIQ